MECTQHRAFPFDTPFISPLTSHLIFVLEHLDLLNHLFDFEAEEAEEGELEEADDAEADDEERVGRGVQPVADWALAALVVVPVGAHAVREPENGTAVSRVE